MLLGKNHSSGIINRRLDYTFTFTYCKQCTKKDERDRKYLENKLKQLENVLYNDDNMESYHNIKDKIERARYT